MTNLTKESNFSQALKYEIKQFCANTSLHGYKFIVRKNTSFLARFAWICIVIISLMISIYLMSTSYYNSLENSTQTVADSVNYPIWNYIFPAVTICNSNKVSLRRLNRFIANLDESLDFDENYIKLLISHLVKILHYQYNSNNSFYYNDLQKLIDANNLTVQDIMMSIRPRCSNLLKICSLKGRVNRCDSLFEEITSVNGFCCSSNYYALVNWIFSGYFSERYKQKPRRMSACGSESGYKILINNQPEDYFLADTKGYATQILIHDPYNYPDWNAAQQFLSASEESFIKITPSITYGTDELHALKLSERKCLFAWEKSLLYFKNYSFINCISECHLNLIKKHCGCVPLYFWNLQTIKFNETQENVCDVKTALCVSSLSKSLMSFFPDFEYNGTRKFDYELAYEKSKCKCLPNCQSRDYLIETSKTIFSRKFEVIDFHFYNGIATKNHSLVSIYFKDLIGVRYRRDSTRNWYSEMAYFGGILGLFLGFSLTSGFELLYFFIRFLLDYFIKNREIANNRYLENKQQQKLPSIKELHGLKRTNNSWFIE